MSKHAVSVSLGSSSRDKTVEIELGGVEVRAERRGVDGDVKAFNRVMRELDGNVDVLSVGGTEIAFHVDGKTYDFHSTKQLIEGVSKTPVVDGSGLKLTLERRVFDMGIEDNPDLVPWHPDRRANAAQMALPIGRRSDSPQTQVHEVVRFGGPDLRRLPLHRQACTRGSNRQDHPHEHNHRSKRGMARRHWSVHANNHHAKVRWPLLRNEPDRSLHYSRSRSRSAPVHRRDEPSDNTAKDPARRNSILRQIAKRRKYGQPPRQRERDRFGEYGFGLGPSDLSNRPSPNRLEPLRGKEPCDA